MKIVESTTRKLFAKLEQEKLRYAVLRNYEDLMSLERPDGTYTDLDLVVDAADFPRLRLLLQESASEAGWDAVTECDHWARSRVRTHNIDVFRLYSRAPLECLQIDVFHGLLVLGLPFFDEQQLLKRRLHDPARGIARIDPIQENIFRLVQMAGLYPNSLPKIERYRQKVIACLGQFGDEYRGRLTAMFGPATDSALKFLVAGDLARFHSRMLVMRAWFASKYILAHPLGVPRLVLHRLRDTISRFYTDQCGAVVRIHAPGEDLRATVRSVMEEMVRHCFMDEWVEQDRLSLGWRERRKMEQGAWIVLWSDAAGATINLSNNPDPADVQDRIWNHLVSLHRPVAITASGPRAQAMECA